MTMPSPRQAAATALVGTPACVSRVTGAEGEASFQPQNLFTMKIVSTLLGQTTFRPPAVFASSQPTTCQQKFVNVYRQRYNSAGMKNPVVQNRHFPGGIDMALALQTVALVLRVVESFVVGVAPG
jgi:hypothetical protein